jgi:hypothetical protein
MKTKTKRIRFESSEKPSPKATLELANQVKLPQDKGKPVTSLN